VAAWIDFWSGETQLSVDLQAFGLEVYEIAASGELSLESRVLEQVSED